MTHNNGDVYEFPPEVGRWVSFNRNEGGSESHPLVPCESVMTDINQDVVGNFADAFNNAMCINPSDALTEGASTFGIKAKPVIAFELCSSWADAD